MGDKEIVPLLLATLVEARSQATELAACRALSRVGDARALEPLLELLQSRDATSLTRAAAAHALGGICDARALPWETPLSVGSNYLAVLPTLTDGLRGVLDYE
jgi:HEAT repeat protein